MTIEPVEIVLIRDGKEHNVWASKGETFNEIIARTQVKLESPYESYVIRETDGVLLEPWHPIRLFIDDWHPPRRPPYRFFLELQVDWPRKVAAVESDLAALQSSHAALLETLKDLATATGHFRQTPCPCSLPQDCPYRAALQTETPR